jgi:hypothetical protein
MVCSGTRTESDRGKLLKDMTIRDETGWSEIADLGFQDRCLKPRPPFRASNFKYLRHTTQRTLQSDWTKLDPNAYFNTPLDSMPMISAARASAFLVRLA